jgi:protein-tyrosine phosphatase
MGNNNTQVNNNQIVVYNNKLHENYQLLNIKRKLVNPYVYSRLIIEKYLYNFSSNNDISRINDFMYIGNYSTSTNREVLKKNGITHILTSLSDFNPVYPEDFKYCHIEAYDDLNENLIYKFPESNLFIKDAHDNGGKIYIHCMCGVSRSVSLAIAYLLFLRQLNYDKMDETEKLNNKIERNIELTTNPIYKELIEKDEIYREINQDILYELVSIKKYRPQANPNKSFLKQLNEYYN